MGEQIEEYYQFQRVEHAETFEEARIIVISLGFLNNVRSNCQTEVLHSIQSSVILFQWSRKRLFFPSNIQI